MNPFLRNIAIGFGIVLAAVIIFGRNEKQKKQDKLLGFTEELGPIATLGAATNRVSGGLLANFGSAIGTFFSSSIFDKRTIDDLTQTSRPADFAGPAEGEFDFVGPTIGTSRPVDFIGSPIG